MTLWDIKELSHHLSIKPSTLYAWVAQGKIPHVKIHRLIRFQSEEIKAWLETFHKADPKIPPVSPRHKEHGDIDVLIARGKREVYNSGRGETRPISSPQKGG